METAPFARARSFLNYRPLAKWSAIAAAVGTGVLFVVLLLVLHLFADLVVNRGRIPTYQDLPPVQQEDFLQSWNSQSNDRRRQLLQELGVANADRLSVDEPTPPFTSGERQIQWRAFVYQLLHERVDQGRVDPEGEDSAAGTYWKRTPADGPPPDLGVLSLVVRTHRPVAGRVVGWLASWNPWMWKYGQPDQPNYPYLTGLLAVAILIGLLRAALMFVMNYMAAVAVIEASIRLRRAIYHHAYKLGTLVVRALGPSEAAHVFTRQVESVHDALMVWLTVGFREPVKFGLLLAYALVINFWLALAFLLFAALVWLAGTQLAAYFRRQADAATNRAATHMALLQESLVLMRLVKVYLMELFNQARVERQLREYSNSHLNRYRGQAVYSPVLIFLGSLAAAVLLYVAGVIVLTGQLNVASAIALVAALFSLYWPLETWRDQRRILRRGREAASVLFRFLDRPGEVSQAAGAEFLPPLSQVLEFDNVNLREPATGRTLLRGVSFQIRAGQKIALVGPEDMQKYALVYLIPRFLDPTTGEIRIDNHNLREVTLDSLRAQIAVVMQHNLVFNDTVANNIGCGDPSYSMPQIIEAAKTAHAHHFVQKLPRGYETPIGELGHSLRAGEQFRIALARAILRDPALLIIEEPSGTILDDDTKSMIDDTFARLLPGRTAIFLPHRISTVRMCDQIILLHEGKIEAAGEHRELLQQSELYQHLHYLEFNMFAGQI